jgi:hypothetical protein
VQAAVDKPSLAPYVPYGARAGHSRLPPPEQYEPFSQMC